MLQLIIEVLNMALSPEEKIKLLKIILSEYDSISDEIQGSYDDPITFADNKNLILRSIADPESKNQRKLFKFLDDYSELNKPFIDESISKEQLQSVLKNKVGKFFMQLHDNESKNISNIVKKSNGVYYYKRMIDGNNIEFSLHTKNYIEANQKAIDYNKKLEAKMFDEKFLGINNDKKELSRVPKNTGAISIPTKREETDPKRTSMPHLFDMWLEKEKALGKAKTSLGIKRNVCNHVIDKMKIFSINNIDQTFINNYIKFLSKYEVNSRNKFLTQLKAFLNFLIKNGLFDRNKLEVLDIPVPKNTVKDTYIAEEDFETIKNYIREKDPDFYLYIMTLFYTLSRPSEALYLRKQDIIYSESIINITISKTARAGKDHKTIPILDEYKPLLLGYIESNHIEGYIFKGAMKDGLPVDISRQDLIKYMQDNSCEYYSKKFRDVREKLKLNPEYNLREFRKTSEMLLSRSGIPIELYTLLAGNSPKVALENYTQYRKQHDLQKLKTVEIKY